MKARFADRLRRIGEKKRTNLLKRLKKEGTGPDFLVLDDKPSKPRSLIECNPEYAFFLTNGRQINNLHQLSEELENMEDHVFEHHVNEEKNDFSSWVEGVCEEKQLAAELKDSKDKEEHHKKLLKHIVKDLTNYIQ